MSSADTTRPVRGSKSWRFTPRSRIGRPLTSSRGPVDLDPPEPDPDRGPVRLDAVGVEQADLSDVQGGHLGRPGRHAGHACGQANAARAGRGGSSARPSTRSPSPPVTSHAPPATSDCRSRMPARGGPGIAQSPGPSTRGGVARDLARERLRQPVEPRLDPPAGPRHGPPPAHAHVEIERARRPVRLEPGVRAHVGEVDGPGGVQEHGAGDPAVPPLVLVLDVRGVGPLHDGQPEGVAARLQDVGHVELGRKVRVLAHPDLDPVEVDDQHALGRADVEHDAPPDPVGGRSTSRS